jgi:hypothetical protein
LGRRRRLDSVRLQADSARLQRLSCSGGRARERRGDVQRRPDCDGGLLSASSTCTRVGWGSGAGLEVRALPRSLPRLLVSDARLGVGLGRGFLRRRVYRTVNSSRNGFL